MARKGRVFSKDNSWKMQRQAWREAVNVTRIDHLGDEH